MTWIMLNPARVDEPRNGADLAPTAAIGPYCRRKHRRRPLFGHVAIQAEQLEDRIALSSTAWQLDFGGDRHETSATAADVGSVRATNDAHADAEVFEAEDSEHGISHRDDNDEREDDEGEDNREFEKNSPGDDFEGTSDYSGDVGGHTYTQTVASLDHAYANESDEFDESDDVSDHRLDLSFDDQAAGVESQDSDSTDVVVPISPIASPDLFPGLSGFDDPVEVDDPDAAESLSASPDVSRDDESERIALASPNVSGTMSPVDTADESEDSSVAVDLRSTGEDSTANSTERTAETSENVASASPHAVTRTHPEGKDVVQRSAVAGDDYVDDGPVVTESPDQAMSEDGQPMSDASGDAKAPETRTNEIRLSVSPDGAAVRNHHVAAARTTSETTSLIDRFFAQLASSNADVRLHRLGLFYGTGITGSEDGASIDSSISSDNLASLDGMYRPLVAALTVGSLTGGFIYRYRQVPAVARLLDRLLRLARSCRHFASLR